MPENEKFKNWRKLLIFFPAICLTLLEMWHPTHFGSDVYGILKMHIDVWWLVHLLQIPLFGLMAVSIFFLTDNFKGAHRVVVCISLWFYLVFYTAFDAIAGVATGSLIRVTSDFTPEQQSVIGEALQRYFFSDLTGGSHSLISEIASMGWLAALTTAASGFYQRGKSPLASLLLVISGVCLWINHGPPYGPIAFGTYTLAALILEFFPQLGKGGKVKPGV